MTLGKLIEQVMVLRGAQYDEDTLTGWVNEIEGQVIDEVIGRAQEEESIFTPYEYGTDAETVLRIPDRFQDVYINYILAKIDFSNQETALYNNDVTMEEAAYRNFEAWYIRNHQPKALPRFRY